MKIALSTQSSPKHFRVLIYSLIPCLWLKLGIEATLQSLTDNGPFPPFVFLWQVVFTTVLTYLLLYFYRKFSIHISDRVREHIKLFKNNPYPMYVYDLKTLRFMTANEAALTLYGYSEREFLSLKVTDIRPDEDVPALISATDKIKLNFNHQYHWSGTWRHRKKDNQFIYVEISSHEIFFDNREAELVLAYNITDKVLQDQKLQALNQDLEKKVMTRTNDLLNLNRRLIDQNKVIKSANLELFTISNQLQEANQKIQEHADLKNKFVSMASHEFRTPLANITFAAGLIRVHLNKLEPQNIITKLQGIETQVTHMVALLDDVLTIGKTDSVKLEVKNSQIDVHQFIARMIQEVRTANGSSHQVSVTMDENVNPYLHTDERFLRNIFINLLNNAIKYSPNNPTIVVHIYSSGIETCFEITDRGIGLSPQDMERIFEPFYRADRTQNIQGTGLGLSIVKRAADLLNAKIHVESEVGIGSVFTVRMPV